MKTCVFIVRACSLFVVLVLCSGMACTATGQSGPAISPQSLAGDWEDVVSPPLKLVLHLRVDASGALSGTIDTPDTPPKHIELTNFKLAGKMLSYTMDSQPGSITEVVSADGTKMLGAYMWTKVGASAAPAAAPFEPLAQIAGDWVAPGGGILAQVLRLRLDANGALTGAIDMPEPITQRLALSHVQVSGRTLSYTMPDGLHTYQGAFSSEGKTVTATGQSTIDGTWQHTRTAAQAAAQEAADASKPANGDWRGAVTYTSQFPGLPPGTETVTFTFHFRSNPESCSVDLTGSGGTETVPCTMTSTGNTVHMDRAIGFDAKFDGTISADGNHLSGMWTMGPVFHWVAPVQIDLTRTASAK